MMDAACQHVCASSKPPAFKIINIYVLQIDESEEDSSPNALLTTEFFEWCCKYFTEPLMNVSAENDPHGMARFEHEYRFQRATRAHRQAVNDYRKLSKYRCSQAGVQLSKQLRIVFGFHKFVLCSLGIICSKFILN